MNFGFRHSDENREGMVARGRANLCRSVLSQGYRGSCPIFQSRVRAGARVAGRRLSTSGTEGSSGVLERRTWEALGLLPKGRWRVRAEGQVETGQTDG